MGTLPIPVERSRPPAQDRQQAYPGEAGELLTELRKNNTWMRQGSQVAQQAALRNYTQALQHSFTVKGRGRPKLKARKRTLPSLEYSTKGFSIRDGRLKLPKGFFIPVVWSRNLPSPPTSVRVYQDSLGHWYASFVTRREKTSAPDVEASIGIDWGVSTTATTTDAKHDLPYRGHRKRCAAELAKAQRKMARRIVRDIRTPTVTSVPADRRRNCTRRQPGKLHTTPGCGPRRSPTA